MPYIRNASGARAPFRSTHLSDMLTRAYIQVYGPQAPSYRLQILEQTDWIIQKLREQYGEDPSADWPREGIHLWIEKSLSKLKTEDILEAFQEQNPRAPAGMESPATERLTGVGGDYLYDPAWNIIVPRISGSEVIPELLLNVEAELPGAHSPPEMTQGDGGDAGRSVRKKRGRSGGRGVEEGVGSNSGHHRVSVVQISTRRSQWWGWLRRLTQEIGGVFDFSCIEKCSMLEGDRPVARSIEEWFHFWHDVLYQAIREDPRIFALLRIIHHRRHISLLVGQTWLDGSGLNEDAESPPIDFLLNSSESGVQHYQTLWVEYWNRLSQHSQIDPRLKETYSFELLAKELKPHRDLDIDSRGYRALLEGGGLWKIPEDYHWQFQQGCKTLAGAVEPPQWAWMRFAMSLALFEPDPAKAVLSFYEAISTLGLIPTEALVRQAGLAKPNFLEDRACRVEDRFEAIYETIYRSAIDTKWTGTVSLDWRQVRSQGHVIGGSQRRSLGVLPFIKMSEVAMMAQGRTGEDRPVTAMLPLWHREAEIFIAFQHQQAPRIQTVLIVPDLFMQRLKENGVWTFFDPMVFPEVLEGSSGYLLAESHLEERRKRHPKSARTVKAGKVWRKVLQYARWGSPGVTFEGSDPFFGVFPQTAPPICGIDGVGAIPSPLPITGVSSWSAWPSMALNLKQCLDEDGKPSLAVLQHLMDQGLRILDNAITASSPDLRSASFLLRPVCLGAVGLHEAVQLAHRKELQTDQSSSEWVASLSEAWAASMAFVDQALVRERGAAAGWKEFGGCTVSPVSAVESWRSHRGSLGIQTIAKYNWENSQKKIQALGQRFGARSVWAPFQSASAIGGVSPGGVGAIRPFEVWIDEYGTEQLNPTPVLLDFAHQHPEQMSEIKKVLMDPDHPKSWPQSIQRMALPKAEEWNKFLEQAALIRPWTDQGVSLTLPAGMSSQELDFVLQQAWWRGVSTIRFSTLIQHDGVDIPDDSLLEVGFPQKEGDFEGSSLHPHQEAGLVPAPEMDRGFSVTARKVD